MGAESATWSLTDRAVTSPSPKKPSPPPVLELAVSVGPNAPMDEATTMPRTTPSRPPSTPWASDSPRTWRITSHCVQPSAFSVPSSRTRLPTEDRVRRIASRKAATAASAASAVPSRFERFAASTSEPLIESATCFALATCARGNCVSICFCTAATSAPLVARTSTTLTTFFWLARPAAAAARCRRRQSGHPAGAARARRR